MVEVAVAVLILIANFFERAVDVMASNVLVDV